MIIIDASTRFGGTVGDGQAGNGDGFTSGDVKYGAFAIAIHRKILSARSRNRDVPGH